MPTVFEKCAVHAYDLLSAEVTDDPHEAWRRVAPSFSDSIHVQRKPCPIATFSGLWYAGFINGSKPRSNYEIGRNAQYAIDGIKELKRNPKLSKSQVWRRLPGTNGGSKAQDGQMDVLFALRQRNLIPQLA
jgi:hypothetical protein